MREVMARAGHPQTGLLLDTYHLGRTGASPRDIEDVRPEEIAYVQYSDVPRTGLEPGKALDRLPPGQGSVPFKEFFAAFARKGYAGLRELRGAQPGRVEAPGRGRGARGAGRHARGDALGQETPMRYRKRAMIVAAAAGGRRGRARRS